MLRKIISTILACSMLFSLATTAFATEKVNYSKMTMDELSSITGVPADDLQTFKSNYTDEEKFNAEIEHLLWAVVPQSATARAATPMTPAQWTSIKNVVQKGSILVTKDAGPALLPYGHAGLVYNSSTTVETLGYDKGNGVQTGLSKTEDINWRGRKQYTCKVFSPKNTGYMTAAGNYAYNNLIGIPYSALCSRYVDAFENCSSLVWKAYYKSGYNIDTAGQNVDVIYPRNICESTDVTLIKSVNWSGTW